MPDSASRSRLPLALLVVALAALLVFTTIRLRATGLQVADARAALDQLDEDLVTLRTTTEALVRERAQARIERAEAIARAAELEAKLETATASVEKARADLARVGAARDEHLEARLELRARLDAILSELAK